MTNHVYTVDFEQISLVDVGKVGGKNASLGELFNALKPKGVNVLDGFATTADAFRRFLGANGLEDRLRSLISGLDCNDTAELQQIGRAHV